MPGINCYHGSQGSVKMAKLEIILYPDKYAFKRLCMRKPERPKYFKIQCILNVCPVKLSMIVSFVCYFVSTWGPSMTKIWWVRLGRQVGTPLWFYQTLSLKLFSCRVRHLSPEPWLEIVWVHKSILNIYLNHMEAHAQESPLQKKIQPNHDLWLRIDKVSLPQAYYNKDPVVVLLIMETSLLWSKPEKYL